MFISDQLAFVELQKTGGSHIGEWLLALVHGHQIGKHNRLPSQYRDRFILGSIRNPWDWYVSLWAYGCSGKGSVRAQTCSRGSLKYYWDGLPEEMGYNLLSPSQYARQLFSDAKKPIGKWRSTYEQQDERKTFRAWLTMMLSYGRRFDFGEGYGFSPISKSSGLLTYRYIKLFTDIEKGLYKDQTLSTRSGQMELVQRRGFVDHFIRNEHLEADLLEGLEKAGISISDTQRGALITARGIPTNSSHRRETSYYYDDSTVALIYERERLIIDLHGYSFPGHITRDVTQARPIPNNGRQSV